MRIRDSGMPRESVWETFFDPETILERLGLTGDSEDVVEFGCGYGTFTIPAAAVVRGRVYALDIDPDMLAATATRAVAARAGNVQLVQRDFMTEGTGLADGAAAYAMLFNILHPLDPVCLLREAHRTLCSSGRLGIIHWNYDATTPRGPDMSFRPRPAQCLGWAQAAGFELTAEGIIDLPPYHWGMTLSKRR